MDKKNTLLLTVIAIATLLVAVVGATFAYFATGTNIAPLNVSATTPSATGSFTAIGGQVTLDVKASDMTQSLAGDHVVESTGAPLVVSYKGGKNTGCTYDLTFKWDADSDTYAPTSGVAEDDKEFTVTMTAVKCSSTECITSSVEERQITAAAGANEFKFSGDDVNKIFTDEDNTGDEGTPVTNTYTLVLKMYNLDHIQSTVTGDEPVPGIDGKHYYGQLYVDNVAC